VTGDMFRRKKVKEKRPSPFLFPRTAFPTFSRPNSRDRLPYRGFARVN